MNLPGQVWGLAAPGADGTVWVAHRSAASAVFTELDLDGTVVAS